MFMTALFLLLCISTQRCFKIFFQKTNVPIQKRLLTFYEASLGFFTAQSIRRDFFGRYLPFP